MARAQPSITDRDRHDNHAPTSQIFCALLALTMPAVVLAADPLPPRYSDWDPEYSPDGTTIVFVSDEPGQMQIFLCHSDGSNRRQLTSDGVNQRPVWSPDGRLIAFARTDAGTTNLYLMDPDGSNQHLIVITPSDDTRPCWSPDGQWIAFDSDRDEQREIYVIKPDGSDLRRLTDSPEFDGYPDWSPDGTRIAFTSGRDGNREIYSMSVDGSDVQRLTANTMMDQAPQWSPDGQWITYFGAVPTSVSWYANTYNEHEIWIMRADGSAKRRLTFARHFDFMPDFSPDGRSIIFDTQREGWRCLATINVDGSGFRSLTNSDRSPFFKCARQEGIDAAISWLRSQSAPPVELFYLDELRALGWSLLDNARIDDARAIFELNAEAHPEFQHPHEDLARLSQILGDRSAAKLHFERSLECNPDDITVRRALEDLTAHQSP